MKDLSELNITELLNETYTTTPIQADKKTADGAVVTVIINQYRREYGLFKTKISFSTTIVLPMQFNNLILTTLTFSTI